MKYIILFTGLLFSIYSYSQPNFTEAVFQDDDGDGNLDQVTLHFDGDIIIFDDPGDGFSEIILTYNSGASSITFDTQDLTDLSLGITSLLITFAIDQIPGTGLEGIDITYQDVGSSAIRESAGGLPPEILDGPPTTLTDAAPPRISNATWNDINPVDGNIDQVVLSFSEPVDVNDPLGLGDGLDAIIIGGAITSILAADYSGMDQTSLELNLSPINGTGITGLIVNYTTGGTSSIADNASPTPLTMTDLEADSYTDAAPPRISNATWQDANTVDGNIDLVVLEFSEQVDIDDVGNASDGLDVIVISDPLGTVVQDAFELDAMDVNSLTLNFDGDPIEGTGIVGLDVSYSVGASAIVDNASPTPLEITDGQSTSFGDLNTDEAPPQITNFEYQDINRDGYIDQFYLTFSEPIDVDNQDSNLSANDLIFSNVGDFTGAQFGSNATNLLTHNITEVVVPLGVLPSNRVTYSATDPTIAAQPNFLLSDNATTPNQNTTQILATVTDGAPPVLTEIDYSDQDGDGIIDQFDLHFSEDLAAGSTITPNHFVVTNDGDFGGMVFPDSDASLLDGGGGTDPISMIGNTEVDTHDDSGDLAIFNLGTSTDYILVDAAGNTNDIKEIQSQVVFNDLAGPIWLSAETGDNDRDGRLDLVSVTFSEDVSIASLNISDFNFDNNTPVFTINDVSTSSGLDEDMVIVSFDEEAYDTDATAVLSIVNGSLVDLSTNTNPSLTDLVATDGAAPAIIDFSYEDSDSPPDGYIDQIQVTFSEVLDAGMSTLRPADLILIDDGDFDGAFFGGSITSYADATNTAVIPLGSPSSQQLTNTVTPLIIATQSDFSLADPVGNVNNQLAIQSQATLTDGAPPVIQDIRYLDSDNNARIDQLQLTFSEPLDATSALPNGSLLLISDGGFTGLAFSGPGPAIPDGSSTVTIDLVESNVENTYSNTLSVGTALGFSIVENASGISNTEEGPQNQASLSDGANPVALSAETLDLDGNGRLDQIRVTFSEDLDPATIDFTPSGGVTDDFSLSDSYEIAYVTMGAASDAIVEINLVEMVNADGNALPEISFAATQIFDPQGNALTAPTSLVPVDGVGPNIFSAITADADGNGSIDLLIVQFDSPISDASLDNTDPFTEDFVVEGFDIAGYDTDPTMLGAIAANDNIIGLILDEDLINPYNTDVTPNITLIANQVEDIDGFSLLISAGNQLFDQTQDGASPIYVSTPVADEADNTYNASETITLTLTTSEPVNAEVNLVEIGLLDNQGLVPVPGGDPTTGYTYTYTTPAANNLIHGDALNVLFSIEDAVGLSVGPGNAITLTIDNVIPTVTINTLETTDNTSQLITGTVDEGMGDDDLNDLVIEVNLNDGAGWQNASSLGGTWSFNTTLGNGIYDIDARVTDLAGNQTLNLNDIDDELQVGGIEVTVPSITTLCIDGPSIALDPIVIQESKINDFKPGTTRIFVIELTPGLNFDQTAIVSASGIHNDLSGINFSYPNTQRLEVELDIDNIPDPQLDVLSINDIYIQASGTPIVGEATYVEVTASLFGITTGATLADLTSIAPPMAPVVRIGDDTGLVVNGELEVPVNSGESLYAEGVGTYRWYDFDLDQIYVGQNPSLANLTSGGANDNTGFDNTAAGLYTIYVSTSDGTCESALTPINIYVYDRQLSPPTTDLFENDEVGVTISLINNLGFRGDFNGLGLTSEEDDGDDGDVDDNVTASAQFVPIGNGAFNITYRVTNTATDETYDFVTTFSVNPVASIFAVAIEDQYCFNDPEVTGDVDISDLDGTGFYFYQLQFRDATNPAIVIEPVSPLETGALVRPSDWGMDIDAGNPINQHKSISDWTIDPSSLGIGDYILERVVLPVGSVDPAGTSLVSNFNEMRINSTPEVVLNAPVTTLCQNDLSIGLTATVGVNVVAVDEYTIHGATPTIVSGSQFDPSNHDPGTYDITFTSLPGQDPLGNSCIDESAVLTITVLENPNPTDIDPIGGQIITGHGQRVGDTFFLEYCEGEAIDNLEFALGPDETIEVYRNSSLTSSVVIADNSELDGILTITQNDLFGGSNPTDQSFYVILRDNLSEANGGCPADPIVFNFVIREVPDNPQLNLGASSAGGQVDQELYEFNYCSTGQFNIDGFENLVMDAALDNESYFNVYDLVGVSIRDHVTANQIIINDPLDPFPDLPVDPGASVQYEIEVVNYDNSFLNTPPSEGIEFTGCISERTTVTINVHGIPNDLIVEDFSGNPTLLGDEVVYYMCQGEFPDLNVNTPDGVGDNYRINWYDGSFDPIIVADNRGNRVTSNDLALSSLNFDLYTAGTYEFYAEINVEADASAAFEGCPSGLTPVQLVMFEESTNTNVLKPDIATTGSLTGGFDKVFEFCVDDETGLDGTVSFDTNPLYGGGFSDQVRWFLADDTGSDIVGFLPIATGTSITASQLGITSETNATFNYGVVHVSDIVNNGDDFLGCESEVEFVQLKITTLPEPAFSFSGINEGLPTQFDFHDFNLDAESQVEFEVWDVDDAQLITSYSESINVNENENEFSPLLPSGVYDGVLTITSEDGCSVSITRQFRIQELIPVNGFYMDEFDEENSNWLVEFQQDNGLEGSLSDASSQRVSSWEHGIPDGSSINTTRNGSGKAWGTYGTINHRFFGGERSWVISPAFDISFIINPAVRMWTYTDTDLNGGVVFQYSLDAGITWQTLGGFDPSKPEASSGFEWYTENGNRAAPGSEGIGGVNGFNDDRVAWSGQYSDQELEEWSTTNGWHESIHSLKAIEGAKNVMFRVAVAVQGAEEDELVTTGFAFDDFELFGLGTNVLIENFVTSVNAEDTALLKSIEQVIGSNSTAVINYYTDFSDTELVEDPFHKRNVAGPNARAAYYGLSGASTSALNGELYDQANPTVSSFSPTDIERKGLDPIIFIAPEIVNLSSDPGIINLSATFVPQVSSERMDLSFVFSIIEKEVIVTSEMDELGLYQPGDVLRNVFRKMLPGTSGVNYIGEIVNGEEGAFEIRSGEWPVTNVYDPTKLAAIAFVQDNETNRILQSGIIDLVEITNTVTGLSLEDHVTIYPNPASSQLTVEFGSELFGGHWSLVDLSGREVLSGPLPKEKLLIDTRDLKVGIYLIKLNMPSGLEGLTQRVMIVH